MSESKFKKSGLSRRSFIGAGAAAAGTLAFTLSGCAQGQAPEGKQTTEEATGDASAQKQSYKAGTYEAESKGRNGKIKVTGEFDDKGLVSLKSEHDESRNIGDFAIDELTKYITDSKSLNVDAITGATLSSVPFLNAVSDVFKQAGADVKALRKGPKANPKLEDIKEDCDVCIVGTGGAALAAAVTAVEAGKSVVMLEKMGIVGGNTNAGEGTLNAPDPQRQEPMGIKDSPEKFFTDTYEGGDKLGDPELVKVLANNALDAVHFLEDHGLKYNDEVFTAIGGKWQRGHSVAVEKLGEQGGSYYVSILRDAAEKGGAKIFSNAKVEKIKSNNGAVSGVEGSRPNGAKVDVTAKSVVLATGGYGQNTELAKKYDKRVTDKMPSSNVSSSTGDGIILGEQVGSALMNMELVQIHPLGDPQNGGVATFVGNWLGVEDYMMVNDEGNRFINEDGRRDELSNAILEQPNQEMWLFVDSTNVEDERLPQIEELIEQKHSFKDDTFEGLARQIGVPESNLTKTVEQYNSFFEAGKDTEQNKVLGMEDKSFALEDGPFYVSKRIPTIHYTMGGLKINTKAEVVDTNNNPIKNLYAAGECTGGVQGGNRLGGNSYTDLIVFGRIAGQSAADNAQ